EILSDRGPAACTCGLADCGPAHDCDRWLELWNLVFTQFDQQKDGTLLALPKPNIDTGMGLERLTSVLQGADNNYDTDLFLPIMERTRSLIGHSQAAMRANVVPYRVIADHARALTFLIAEGVLPGNEGRSYVVRMVLRRAARFGRMLGFQEPFLAEAAQAVIDTMGDHYRELRARQAFVREAITLEEERFLATLSAGLSRLDTLAERVRVQGASLIPGEEAFRLYDTFGFPIELTLDAARELGLSVDEAGFAAAMSEQRERARAAQRFAAEGAGELYRRFGLPATRFVGYVALAAASAVVGIVRAGQSVRAAVAGEQVEIVLDATPFYGESGGQLGDTGELRGPAGRALVRAATHPTPELTAHQSELVEGRIAVGDRLAAQVDAERRLDIARNHTATHLLHRALRTVLGSHAAQAGSLVAPDHLRFDFAHLAALSAEELQRVEESVNAAVRADAPVRTQITSYDEALRQGAIALFGEKYGDRVRMVQVEGHTTELCGGTHLRATGQIGVFVITGEGSIGSGLRRIEALTGRGAEAHLRERRQALAQLAELLGARPGEELPRAQALVAELRDGRRTAQVLQQQLAAASVDGLSAAARQVGDVKVLAQQVTAADADALRDLCDRLRDKLGSAVVALGAVIEGRPLLMVALTPDLVTRGLHAGKLVGAAAERMGGRGGGRPNLAQAGGRDIEALPAALAAVPELVAAALGGH
ncbi:MAG: alanine--tRNA ligase, partial [Chloroflexota bacterium]